MAEYGTNPNYSDLAGADQVDPTVAWRAMQARIDIAVNACSRCQNDTDRLIVAALAQNGAEFTPDFFKSLPTKNGSINWEKFFSKYESNPSDQIARIRQTLTGLNYGSELMLKLYYQDLLELLKLGYQLPNKYEDADLEYTGKLVNHFPENK